MPVSLKVAAAEMERVGDEAQRLATSVAHAVGGSATGVDKELVGALAALAKHMRAGVQALHHAESVR